MSLPDKTIGISIVLFAFWVPVFYAADSQEQALNVLAKMKLANNAIVDMRCEFTMDIIKKSKRLPKQRMIFRYRSNPETIHLTFLNPHKGRKVLYVRGDEKMKVRPDGFWKFTTVSLDPNSERAMEDGIDPITSQGFPQIVSAAGQMVEDSLNVPGYRVLTGEKIVDGSRNCVELSIRTPQHEEYTLLIDSTTFFPYKILKSTPQGRAVYVYDAIQLNPGMPDREFKL